MGAECHHPESAQPGLAGSELAAAVSAAEVRCEQSRERLTPPRRRVLQLLLEADGPMKAYDLIAAYGQDGEPAKPPTVYRALDFLMTAGLVHKVEALNAFVGCSHAHDEGGAELFICSDCGSVEERHGAPEPVHTPDGFVIERSVVEHFGHCGSCKH